MDHPSHKLNAYCQDYKLRTVYCEYCEKEEGLNEPCAKTFYQNVVDLKIDNPHTQFVSGLP
jgi:hypothetical protein